MTVLLFFLAAMSSVVAEQITIDDARALALTNSTSLAKYNLALESARLEEKTRIYGVLPSVSLGVSASGQVWGDTSLEDSLRTGASFSVSQKLFDGGKNSYLKAINAINAEVTRQDALAAYFSVLDAADSACYELLKAEASAETARVALENAALALSMAELRLQNGMISRGDYLKALADQGAKETALNRALQNLSLSREALKNITGLGETPELAAIDFNAYEDLLRFLSALSQDSIAVLTEKFSAAARANNPGLLKSSLQLQAAERNVGLAKKDYLPSLSASTSAGINYSAVGGVSYSGGSVSVSGSIPLDYWVIGTAVEKKRAAQAEAALNYRDAENALGVDIQTALLDLVGYALAAQSARRADEYARQSYEYNLELYKLSQASVVALSEAAGQAVSSHAERIAAEYGFLSGLSKLRSLGAFASQDELINLLVAQ
ncbi:MAG: TolC family protein [Treponema sp.]|nr:TolC family protein [Treponema sp.]